MKIRIVVTKTDGRYWAEVLGLPCLVSGRTQSEARTRARKAIKLYFDAAAKTLRPTRRAGKSVRVMDVAV